MQFCGMDTNAPWSGGFSTAFSWKGLGLNMDFSWIGERWIFINERYYTMNPANQLQRSNFETKMLNMWTTPGQKTDIPKYGTQFYFDTSAYSNASFIRMKNISLSYSFPRSLIQKSGFLSSVKVYVTGRNLWTITDFKATTPKSDTPMPRRVCTPTRARLFSVPNWCSNLKHEDDYEKYKNIPCLVARCLRRHVL